MVGKAPWVGADCAGVGMIGAEGGFGNDQVLLQAGGRGNVADKQPEQVS